MATTVEPITTVTVRIPESVKGALDALATSTGQDKDTLVAEALRRFIALQRLRITDIEEGIRAADAGDFATDAEMDALWAKYGLENERANAHAIG